MTGNRRAAVLGEALDRATEKLLLENRSPARKLGSIDNRGSHYWLARYWAEALASQSEDAELAAAFAAPAGELAASEKEITAELLGVQGSAADIGGYYRPDDARATAVMRPSGTLNAIVDAIAR